MGIWKLPSFPFKIRAFIQPVLKGDSKLPNTEVIQAMAGWVCGEGANQNDFHWG